MDGASSATAGPGGNYHEGISSFYTSHEPDIICATKHNILSSKCIIINEKGKLVADLGKNSVFLSDKLIWLEGNNNYPVVYRKMPRVFPFTENKDLKEKLIFYNPETKDRKACTLPKSEKEYVYYNYIKWSEKQNCLIGVKTVSTDAGTSKNYVFKYNIETDDIQEIDVSEDKSFNAFYPTFIDESRLLFKSYNAEDGDEDNSIVILNINNGEKKRYVLPGDVISWQLVADSNEIVAVQKLFKDNIVSYQIIEYDYIQEKERVLLGESVLPKMTFEDIARGNNAYVALQLSASSRWVAASVTEKNISSRLIIDRKTGKSAELFETNNKEEYAGMLEFSEDEEMVFASFSRTFSIDDFEENRGINIKVYDLSNLSPVLVSEIQCEQSCYNFKFFNNKILYIKASQNNSMWKNKNQLWVYDIAEEKYKPFIAEGKEN